jgi:hypothetical protein
MMELYLQLGEIEGQLRSLQADAARDRTPDKEPFDIDALAAVYPTPRPLSQWSDEGLEELRTKYYLDFAGTTLAAYAEHLLYHDMHEAN